MKRMRYVDNEGKQVNVYLERRKPLLKLFFIIGNILPIVLIGLIIYTVNINNSCNHVYKAIKKASKVYLEDQGELPDIEGENMMVSIEELYSEQYLKSSDTNDIKCTGNVKVTKYNKEYVYTLDVMNCNQCTTAKKYKGWSALQSKYPSNKSIVDVKPYYNYYKREINMTKWSDYFDESAISDEVSEEYGIKLPLDETKLPKVPVEGTTIKVEQDTTYYYSYMDRSWKWYNIVGDYSEFSSERPEGYGTKDKDTLKYTEWTEYSQNYPTYTDKEKEYREIQQTTGYKFYYKNKKGEKVYFNDGQYAATSDVDRSKYKLRDSDTVTLYKYRDKVWRWYNGQKRKYSGYSSTEPKNYPYKDMELSRLSSATAWKPEKRTVIEDYRIEQKKLMTRFRVQYEILSLPVLNNPIDKDAFEKKVGMTVLEFSSREDRKLETTYKFRYRKS